MVPQGPGKSSLLPDGWTASGPADLRIETRVSDLAGESGPIGLRSRGYLDRMVSENGPREGTRDLPQRDRDAGHRAVDPTSPAGRTYAAIGRAARRRREELLELARQGLSVQRVVELYQLAHPLEPKVTTEEVRALSRHR